jgi:hypothetical protein
VDHGFAIGSAKHSPCVQTLGNSSQICYHYVSQTRDVYGRTIEQGPGYKVNLRTGLLVFAKCRGKRFYKIKLNFANFSPKIVAKIVEILTVPKNV